MIGTIDKPWIDLDPFIDIESLKSLEMEIILGICRSQREPTCYGLMIRDATDYFQAKQRILALPEDDHLRIAFESLRGTSDAHTSDSKLFSKFTDNVYSGGFNVNLRLPSLYAHKNNAAHCKNTEDIRFFPNLMKFITALPFTEIGRVTLFVNDHDLITPTHVDSIRGKWHKNEFMWFRTNLNKKFFVYDPKADVKHYITSHAAFFNEQTWHGTDAVHSVCFSIRVDGVFTEDLRRQLNIHQLTNYNDPNDLI